MIYTKEKLIKAVGCCESTLYVKLGRAEFSHITKESVPGRKNRKVIVFGHIDKYDIQRLKELSGKIKRKV